MVDTLQHITRLSPHEDELKKQGIHPTLGRRGQVYASDIPEQALRDEKERSDQTIAVLREQRRISLQVWTQPFTR